jgi:Bacterial Ig-like domain
VTEPTAGIAAWDAERIRLRGLPPGTDVRVRPVTANADLPPTAGSVVPDADDLLFAPRFPFVPGTTYTVYVDGVAAATLSRPREQRRAATTVLEIHPTAPQVPRNLLRCYVQFSAPMGRGYVADHVRLFDGDGSPIKGALLPADHELWDAERTRLTVLLDPGRIKRGLLSHGYALNEGGTIQLVVDQGFRDAHGQELPAAGTRRYSVGADERRRVAPEKWTRSTPRAATREPFTVEFDRPLDHAMLTHSLRVVDPAGRPVTGTPAVAAGERSWQLTPDQPWSHGSYTLAVDPELEDLAGNSVTRVFDRELGGSPAP